MYLCNYFIEYDEISLISFVSLSKFFYGHSYVHTVADLPEKKEGGVRGTHIGVTQDLQNSVTIPAQIRHIPSTRPTQERSSEARE